MRRPRSPWSLPKVTAFISRPNGVFGALPGSRSTSFPPRKSPLRQKRVIGLLFAFPYRYGKHDEAVRPQEGGFDIGGTNPDCPTRPYAGSQHFLDLEVGTK